jgi:hypothetical protein
MRRLQGKSATVPGIKRVAPTRCGPMDEKRGEPLPGHVAQDAMIHDYLRVRPR